MKHRHGGKFGKNHGTLTDAAAVIADIGNTCPHVTRVIPGPISVPRASSGASRRVKAVVEGHALKLSVTRGASHQTLHMYATDNVAACQWIKAKAEAENFAFVSALLS